MNKVCSRAGWLAVRGWFMVVGWVLASATMPSWAQSGVVSAEYQIKAAYLYKFLNFIEWPPSAFAGPDVALVIGVLGANVLADELLQVTSGRRANGRDVQVRKLRQGDSPTGLHVLFVGRSESGQLPALAAAVKGQHLMIVSESDEAFAQGSAINFVVIDDRVRFDVALGAAEQSSLKISARLLAVARKVIANPS